MTVVDNVGSPIQRIMRLQQRRLWLKQAQIVHSVWNHPRTSVRGCTGWGKTFTAGSIAVDFVTAHQEAIVLCTATRWEQVKRQVMTEVASAASSTQRRIVDFPSPTKTMLDLSTPAHPKRYIECLSPNDQEGIGGYHAKNVLIIIDEASGVREAIHEGIEGPMSSGNVSLLELGNPLNAVGPFVDHHTSDRSLYNCFAVSAWETPNFAPLAAMCEREGLSVTSREGEDFMCSVIADCDDDELASWVTWPELTRPRWVRDMLGKWGQDHPMWEARIGGRFPRYSEHALVPLAWIEAAAERPAIDTPGAQVEVGIDVGGPGEDETAVCVRCGDAILATMGWRKHECVGDVIAFLQTWGKRIGVIRYDVIGVGAHFGAPLKEAFPEAAVVPVNVSTTEGVDTDEFPRLRDALHWAFRLRMQDGAVSGWTDDVAQAQASTVEYGHDLRGRVKVVEKKTLPKSPDRFEAMLLAFWEGWGRVGGDAEPAFNVDRERKPKYTRDRY